MKPWPLRLLTQPLELNTMQAVGVVLTERRDECRTESEKR